MRTLTTLTVLILCALSPAVARAQEPDAQQHAALLKLANDQLRRIEALEARLAELQQAIKTLSDQRGVAPGQPPVVTNAPEEEPPMDLAVDGGPPQEPDAEGPSADLPRAGPIDAYGSLRAATVWDARGDNEIRNNGTRLGIRGQKKLAGSIEAFARLELGVNMVANDRIIISGDPGASIGQGSQAMSSRLGFVGLDTPVGAFSWGKQWSAYYDVAEFADQFQIFSGFANGAFAAGTDGGIVGTGRAERAFLYRETRGPVSAAVQVQNRASSPNDRSWADAWGLSTVIEAGHGIAFGAAYNEVRDGIEAPGPNEPHLGDKATIFGARIRRDKWYAGATYSVQKQHDIDDLGRRFDGDGFELALRRDLTDRIWIEGGYNDLRPNSSHPGDYRVKLGVANVVYRYGDASRFFVGVKFDGSTRSDGGTLRENAFAGGINFTF